MSESETSPTVLIDRFLADFNAIEKFFRKELDAEQHVPFRDLLRKYCAKHAGWKREQQLRMIAEVRSLMTHERNQDHRYPVVPTLETVSALARYKMELLQPRSVYDAFRKSVHTVTLETPLLDVLERIRVDGYTHFPVYNGASFVGLISENGIARWLAKHVTEMTIVEISDVSLQEILSLEEAASDNFWFIDCDMRLDDLFFVFPERPLLEAALITHSGKSSESLLGIATRWDLVSELNSMQK